MQTFIEKTLRPNLAHYKTTQPNDVEDFLAVGVSIVLRRAYEIAKAEAGADSIWEVYDSLSMENMVKVILVAVLADFMLEMAHPHVQHTQQSARDIHASAGQFLHP